MDSDIKIGDEVKIKGSANTGIVEDIKAEFEHGRSTKALVFYVWVGAKQLFSYHRGEITKV